MNQLTKLFAALLVVGVAGPASAIQYKFSGDFNNRFEVYNNQNNFFGGAETIAAAPGVATGKLFDKGVQETYGDFKLRLQAEAATDDKAVRGVYALELGAIKYGSEPNANGIGGGGRYSGDGLNYETRFAYIDFALGPKHRVNIGLQPFIVNKYLWQETATGISLKGNVQPVAYTLAWMRGVEAFNTTESQQLFRDADNILLRGDFVPMKDSKVGVFGVFQHARPEGGTLTRTHLLKTYRGVDYDIFDLGLDGSIKFPGGFFANGDFIYQFGESEGVGGANKLDHSAFFAHLDLGYDFSKQLRVTYTGWYASGDDNAADGDIKNFTATDVDMTDSIILFEGALNDDNYFTEAPYFLTAGAIFNKLALDYKATEKLTLGIAGMYILTAEDVTLAGGKTANDIGFEIDGAISYKINPNLELAWNAGYLIGGDALDNLERNSGTSTIGGNGSSDVNIFRTTARARYVF